MTAGLKCWDASGHLTFDTTFASWFVLRDDIVLNSNAGATYSFPDAAGMEVSVIESPLYDAGALGYGNGTFLALQHTVVISYASGYPVVTLSMLWSYNVSGAVVAIPMRVYVLGRYP